MERPDRLSKAMDELVLIAAGAVLLLVLAAGPSAAVLLHTGQLHVFGVDELLQGWISLITESRWADPASGFAYPARTAMPGRIGFWAAMIWLAVLLVVLLFALVRLLDATAAKSTLGRRWWSLRGARPRSWARPRDLRSLQITRRPVDRMALGTIGERPRLLAAEEEMHIAVLAPTGAGKTSGLVIPWVIEAPGPVISLSVKPDVFQATQHIRAERGRVWVWDPFGPTSCGWSPLLGCETWSGALRRAKGLADAVDRDSSEGAVFWNGEGAKLLAPLLHAAAAHQLDMNAVLLWLDQRVEDEPLALLHDLIEDAEAEETAIRRATPPPGQRRTLRARLRELESTRRGARSAAAQLEAILSLDARNAGTTYMSAASMLAAYRYPEVQRTESRDDFSAEALLDCTDGQANTLYIVAGAEDQTLLAPIIVALLTEVMALGDRRAATDGAYSPTVRFVGDELTNIAPIRSLPRYLSTLRAPGFRFAIVAQNISQLRSVFGPDDVDTILTNCQAKLFLGPITCTQTIEYLDRVLGDVSTATETRSSSSKLGDSVHTTEAQMWRPRASPRELQQLGERRALLLHSTLPAAVIKTVPWWEVDTLNEAVRSSAPASNPYAIDTQGSGDGVPSPRQSAGAAREPAGGAT